MQIDLVNTDHWKRHLDQDEPLAGLAPDNVDGLVELLPEGHSVLCVGSGSGYEIEQLRKMGRDAIGLSRNLIEVKSTCTKGLPCILGDMHDLPFRDEAFDCVFCKDTWEHSVAPFISLSEMVRVTKEGGYVLINLPDESWIECIYHYSVLNERQVAEMFDKCKLEFKMIGPGIYLGRKNSSLEYSGRQ